MQAAVPSKWGLQQAAKVTLALLAIPSEPCSATCCPAYYYYYFYFTGSGPCLIAVSGVKPGS